MYHGFPILEEVEVRGFRLGMITGWESAPADYGDAFIVAPDNGRAGLIWEVGSELSVEQSEAPSARRWGVWAVTVPEQMHERAAARRNLERILEMLEPVWDEWRHSGEQ